MKYSILLVLSLIIFIATQAQDKDKTDDLILKAMQDELVRNREQLSLPGMPSPFYIGYVAGQVEYFRISGELGGITDSYIGHKASSGVELMLGDYQKTSNSDYSNQLMMSSQMPVEPDYNTIRRNFWRGTDRMYKWAQQSASAKESFLTAYPPAPEETALADFEKVPSVQKIIQAKNKYTIDRSALENMVQEISAVFNGYREIFNSMVSVSGFNRDIYRVTSDSVVLKQPMYFTSLVIQASVLTSTGENISDVFSLITDRPDALPAVETLKKQAIDFAENLLKLKNAPLVEEYYSGPVLFEGWPCFQAISGNLLHQGGLFAFRKPATNKPAPQTLGKQINRQIIDPRLTIKNYPALDTYNGSPLLGAYEIDAEGIVPASEMILVEKGVLRGLLNGCYPCPEAPRSTGSSRFVLSDSDLSYGTAPGTIHIQADKGLKPEQMKKALLKAAKTKGLEYAYIVRKIAGAASCVYRINVKDGSETLVRFAAISPVKSSQLKEIREISAEENVANYVLNSRTLSSAIYPSSILMDDIQISRQQVNKQKALPLKYPLQR